MNESSKKSRRLVPPNQSDAPPPKGSNSSAQLNSENPYKPSILIKVLFRQQGLFIMGTLIIVLTWYQQTFIIDNNNEEISFINDKFQNLGLFSTQLDQKQFEISQLETLKPLIRDSTIYFQKKHCYIYEEAMIYCNINHLIELLKYGKDSLDSSVSKENSARRLINEWNGAKNYKDIIA